MRKRLVFALGLCVVAAAAIGPAQSANDPLLTLYGSVRLTTSPDGLMTAVTVDLVPDGAPADGLVERAFRVQHGAAEPRAFDGLATVVFRERSLVVSPDDQRGWVFALDAAAAQAAAPGTGDVVLLADGLSHFWGDRVHGDPDQVAARLLGPGCAGAAADGDPSCENCQEGGTGTSFCSITCDGGDQCSAKCADGLYPCCKCPLSCRCCLIIPGPRRARPR
jgi:hypothetical protein